LTHPGAPLRRNTSIYGSGGDHPGKETAEAKTSQRRVIAADELAQTWKQIQRPHTAGRYTVLCYDMAQVTHTSTHQLAFLWPDLQPHGLQAVEHLGQPFQMFLFRTP
ncbi:hypothetical protein T08_12231, partial [Trichinella sp. T8]